MGRPAGLGALMAPKLALGKMVGPLPLGVWGVAIGGAMGLSVLIRKRQAAGAATTPVLGSGQVPYAQPQAMGEPDWQGAFGLPPAPSGPAGPIAIVTNTDWQRAVVITLAGRGFQSYAVQQALAKHLQGLDALTADEAAIVEAAYTYQGPPPQPPTVAPPPLPPSAPPPGAPPPRIPGTVDPIAPGSVRSGPYFGLPGSGVAINPTDRQLGRFGAWQTGAHIPEPSGWRSFAIAQLRQRGVAVPA